MSSYEYVVKFDKAPNRPGNVYYISPDRDFDSGVACSREIDWPVARFASAEAAIAAVDKYNLPFTLVPVKKPEPLPEATETVAVMGRGGRLITGYPEDYKPTIAVHKLYRVRVEFLERLDG